MLVEKFQRCLRQQFHLHPANTKLILAVSGGVDSVVLTDLVARSGFDFLIAHCNFQLRGEESIRDEAFVRSLEKRFRKQVLVKTFDTERYAAESKLSIQEAARELRYKWFHALVGPGSFMIDEKSQDQRPLTSYLATAHHANDNIETLLINFFRGTGISGLHGIPAQQGKIIRPLLSITREEIVSYATDNNLQWVEDSSNISDKYTRNFFRLNIIPSVKHIYPHVEENLLHNIEKLKEAEILYQQAIQRHIKSLCEQDHNEIHIPILKLRKSEPLNTIIWEIIRQYDFHSAQIGEVKKIIDGENGSYIASPSHRVIKNRKWLIIAPIDTDRAENILIEKTDRKIKLENGVLQVENIPVSAVQHGTSTNVASLDAKEIKFPLLVRKWRQGDYFYPLGMNKKKKLAKFFIDQKLSKTEKENVWIVEMNKKILWVIGHRIDDRFKITASTTKVLHLTFRK